MRTSADPVINPELKQLHIVHRLSAAQSADPEECDVAAPLTEPVHLTMAHHSCCTAPTDNNHYGKSGEVVAE